MMCSASSPSLSRAGRSLDWEARLWGSWIVVLLCTAVHGLSAVTQWRRGYMGLLEGMLFDRDLRFRVAVGGQYWFPVDHGEVFRLFTSTLLHGDGLHLLVNAISILALGRVLEPWFGGLRVLVWFSLGAVLASVGSHLVGVPQSDGASGGAFALLGAALYLGYRHRDALDAPTRRLMGPVLLGFIALNIVLSFALPSVDVAAHLFGLGAGVVFALLARTRDFRRPRWVAWGLGSLWLLAYLGTCVGGWVWLLLAE